MKKLWGGDWSMRALSLLSSREIHWGSKLNALLGAAWGGGVTGAPHCGRVSSWPSYPHSASRPWGEQLCPAVPFHHIYVLEPANRVLNPLKPQTPPPPLNCARWLFVPRAEKLIHPGSSNPASGYISKENEVSMSKRLEHFRFVTALVEVAKK